MEVSIDRTRWYDRLMAAFIFFTRLPFWRMYQPPKEAYTAVVEYWPMVGWLTGSAMAAILYFGAYVLPYPVAVMLAIATRMLLTGALHEDGLADFFDGFGGGGTDRQRILDIMKDSRIGTYGVLGLTIYAAMLFATLYSLPPFYAALTILAADPFAKMATSQIVMMMPYARNEATAKARVVYRRMGIKAGIGLALQGMLPMAAYCYYLGGIIDWQLIIFLPCLTMYFLYLFILHRLRGYTGDCCGAMFLLVELSVYLVACHFLQAVG